MTEKISFMGNFVEYMKSRQQTAFHGSRAAGASDTPSAYALCVDNFSNHMVSVLALQSPLAQLISSGGSPLSADQIERYTRLLLSVHEAALTWVEGTSGLDRIPRSFSRLSDTMDSEFTNAIAYASRLKTNPTDAGLIKEFSDLLSDCCSDLTLNLETNTGILVKNLTDYSQQLVILNHDLASIVAQAMADRNVNQTKLTNLKSQIEAAQDKINGLIAGIATGTVVMIGSGIAVGIAGAAGPIGWLCGLVIAGFFIAGAVTAVVCGALLGAEQNLKSGLEAEKAPLETSLVVLQAYADQVGHLVTDTDGLTAQLTTIRDPWQQLLTDLNAASVYLNAAVSASSETSTNIDWSSVISNLTAAKGFLPTLQLEAQALHVSKPQVLDTSGLDKDMSAEALAQAFNNAPRMDFDKFIYKKYA